MIWDIIKHFTLAENWGQASGMNGMLVLLMDAIRERWGEPVVIHCGIEIDGHAKDSQHKLGNAVDFHVQSSLPFPAQCSRLESILKDLQVFNKVGLGIYPGWNNPGFHLDVRGAYARWGRIDTKKPGGKIDRQYVGYGDALEHAKRKPNTH